MAFYRLLFKFRPLVSEYLISSDNHLFCVPRLNTVAIGLRFLSIIEGKPLQVLKTTTQYNPLKPKTDFYVWNDRIFFLKFLRKNTRYMHFEQKIAGKI